MDDKTTIYQLKTDELSELMSRMMDDVTTLVAGKMGKWAEEMLTIEEVAEEYGVHVNTVRKWVNDRKVTVVDLTMPGKKRGIKKIMRSDLMEFFERSKVEAVCQHL